jgi:hypothetical protein
MGTGAGRVFFDDARRGVGLEIETWGDIDLANNPVDEIRMPTKKSKQRARSVIPELLVIKETHVAHMF